MANYIMDAIQAVSLTQEAKLIKEERIMKRMKIEESKTEIRTLSLHRM